MLRKSFDKNDPAAETEFQKETAMRLLEFEDALERGNYIRAVEKHFFIPAKKMESLVDKCALAYDGRGKQERIRHDVQPLPKKQSTGKETERVLFSMLAEEPEIFGVVKRILQPDDFVDPFCEKVAEILFGQLKSGTVSPAKILNHFETEEEQKDAAMLLNAELRFEKKEDKERALKDVLVKIKERSFDKKYEMAHTAEELIQNRNEKSKLKDLSISLE